MKRRRRTRGHRHAGKKRNLSRKRLWKRQERLKERRYAKDSCPPRAEEKTRYPEIKEGDLRRFADQRWQDFYLRYSESLVKARQALLAFSRVLAEEAAKEHERQKRIAAENGDWLKSCRAAKAFGYDSPRNRHRLRGLWRQRVPKQKR